MTVDHDPTLRSARTATTRTRRRWRAGALAALAAALIPFSGSAAGAQDRPAPPPPNCFTIDFDRAAVDRVPGPQGTVRHRLTVSGNQPYFHMDVRLEPLVYVQQPDYWGIEVTGCMPGDVGLPVAVPYTVTYEFAGTLGTRGIEVIGSNHTERFDLTGQPAPGPLAGTEWVLQPGSLGMPVPKDRPVTASFSDTHVGGRASCNFYSGEYKASGNRISVGAIITTKIACDPATARVEAEYLRRLNGVTSYTLSRDRLVLSGPAGTLRFRSAPVDPRAT
jgi:heat shock protein HslJ